MNTSFYNGISGVKTHQFGLDVWADNISNVSTTGFRSSTPEFSTQFATTLTDAYFDPTTNNSGLGSQAQGTALNMSQGILQPTDNVFDLSIGGEGWFGVQGIDNQTYYTRTSAFSVDAEGNMVDGAGNYLLGTSGGNITATTLSQEKLQQFGQYYKTNTQELGEPFAITQLQDIDLSSVDTQNKINLPDILYFPPKPTSYIDYQANINPEIQTKSNIRQINTDHNVVLTPSYPTATITGTMANDTQIENLKEGDKVIVKLKDDSDNLVSLTATLDANLDFAINNADISALNNTAISLFPEMEVLQEIPNVERFTTEIIAPDGNKDIVDMTFTKRVPQQSLETTWDVDIQILRYEEKYEIQNYNPAITYDTSIYNVDVAKGQVTKIYDPANYKVDKGQGIVYEIIDEQSGDATFGGGGQLISSNIPTLSNSGEPIDINIGTPYATQSVNVSGYSEDGSTLTITGSAPNIEVGESVQIDVTDIDGRTIRASGVVKDDGTWTAVYENNPLDTTSPLTTNAYNVIHNGFDGMISHVDLDKARRSDSDGIPEGYLKEYGMDGRGNVIAEFSNGRSSPVAKVAVYHFQNDQGLEKITSTMFAKSSNSGEAIFYTDEDGNPILGSDVYSNRLEGSNVNMATALTELIVMQKAFDASAKSITTSDELIQNAINMKR